MENDDGRNREGRDGEGRNGEGATLITGASGGIGYELAREFARHGHDLILVARSEEKLHTIADELKEAYGVSVHTVRKDLSEPESAGDLYRELARDGVSVDTLVNNAGIATYGPFHEVGIDAQLAVVRLNITALTELTGRFLPHMVARRRGTVINVASTASLQPGPLMAVYYASKAYVLYFSEAIARELAGTGVTVTTLCPGPTESGFHAQANMENSRLVALSPLMSAERVAKVGYRAAMRGKALVIPGLLNRVVGLVPRILPRRLVTRLVKKVQEPAGA